MKIKSYKTEKLITNVCVRSKGNNIGKIDVQDPRIKQISLLEVDFQNPNNHMVFELQDISCIATESFTATFLTPNNISILLYVYRNELKKYRLTLKKHVLKNDLGMNYEKENKLAFTSKMIYEMIQYAETAIIFGYTALEAFANSCIPDTYVYEFTNNKGIVEKYDLKAIERWLSLSDKLKNVLGDIFDDTGLANNSFWSDFKDLENIRNSIVHLKKEEDDFFHIFFEESTIRKIESIELIIKYFVDIRGNHYIPLSDFNGKIVFSKTTIPANEVKNMEVNFLSEIDTGKTKRLIDLLDEFDSDDLEGSL